ncbi:helix-turn-helix domain-containing protein [Candidatus Micrarchaeota archaeon]|nr:helix-turn-helix domain-containing protein [Candidatus Micrarchaeota archaeon]
MADNSKAMFDFKKKIDVLKKFRGRGTELVTVYITPGYPLHETAAKLRDEYGQAANIKSKTTQKNVQGALERILNELKMYKKTPENGMALFCGNISEVEGRTDIQLFVLEPPMPLNTQFYRCESTFVIEPLEELADSTDTYGLVVMDGKEATVALLQGKKIKIIKQLHSTAHQKVSKGGQCVQADTLVSMEDGRILEIKDLRAGEKIAAADFADSSIKNTTVPLVFTKRTTNAIHVTTKNPIMSLTSTAEHRYFVATEDGIVEKQAHELTVGDFLMYSAQLPSPSHYSDDIRDLDAWVERRTHVTPSGRELLRQRRLQLGLNQRQAAFNAGTSQMSISDLETGEYDSIQRLDQLLSRYMLNHAEFYQEHTTPIPSLKIPERLTPEFAQFLGHVAGDGSLDNNRLKLYDGDSANLEKYAHLVKTAFALDCIIKQRTKKYGFKNAKSASNPDLTSSCHELRVHNKTLATLVRDVFPELITSSENRQIPQRILCSGPHNLAAFVRGVYDAEASASSSRISLAMTSRTMIRQLQLVLLRYGIVSSVYPKKSHNSPQYAVDINDSKSLEAFQTYIGFSSPKKVDALKRILSAKSRTNYTDTVPIHGKYARTLIQKAGFKVSQFPSATMFLNGKRTMSQAVFQVQIVDRLNQLIAQSGGTRSKDAKTALEALESAVHGHLRMVRIHAIQHQKVKAQDFYDLNIPGFGNFAANGLIVHNSAARYSRLHTEAVEYYYTRIGEAMNAFVGIKNFKGVIVGGPGPAKHDFVKQAPQNYQLKILGVVDTGYTDEYGIRETLEKSDEIIASQEAVVEKKLMDNFMREVSTGGLTAYGLTDIQAKLANKQIDKLLVTEGLELKKFTGVCGQCKKEKIVYGEVYNPQDCSCGGKFEIKGGPDSKEGVEDVMESLLATAEQQGVTVIFISKDTAEGAQFYATFRGLGAFLRYK